MEELGIDLFAFRTPLQEHESEAYLYVSFPAEAADKLPELLAESVRRCYVSDDLLDTNASATGQSRHAIIQAKLPDLGAVMSGDFAEILAAIYLAARAAPPIPLDPKKWRLKQDRTKPVPRSDVVQFHLPHWPEASPEDRLVCAEVKAKATRSNASQVEAAIKGAVLDRESRLAATLVWLRERALGDGHNGTVAGGTVALDHLDRFIRAIDFPEATRDYFAVVVVCSSLVDDELDGVEHPAEDQCSLIVLSVPGLKASYEAVFEAVLASVDEGG